MCAYVRFISRHLYVAYRRYGNGASRRPALLAISAKNGEAVTHRRRKVIWRLGVEVKLRAANGRALPAKI